MNFYNYKSNFINFYCKNWKGKIINRNRSSLKISINGMEKNLLETLHQAYITKHSLPFTTPRAISSNTRITPSLPQSSITLFPRAQIFHSHPKKLFACKSRAGAINPLISSFFNPRPNPTPDDLNTSRVTKKE